MNRVRRMLRALAAVSVAALLVDAAAAGPLRREVLDDLRDAAPWKASASDQVQARLRDGGDGSLCLDVDFAGVSGYAVMRRELPVDWPERFDLVARLRASGATNDFQFKLVDTSGDNVWWMKRPDASLPATLTDVTIRGRQIGFAWGPSPDPVLRRTRYVEFVIAAGRDGGRTTLCLARLTLVERAPDPPVWPAPRLVQAGRTTTVDFGHVREFNGVQLRWPAGAHGLGYDLLGSSDARRWHPLRSVRGSDGGLDALWLPDQAARYLRVRMHVLSTAPTGSKPGVPMPEVVLRSADEWPSFNAMLGAQAADAPRGDLPRAFVGEQNYWTLVGVDGGGPRSGLISEDGAIEVGRGGFSIEPAVQLDDGSRVTWAGAALTQTLREGYLPQPAVHWRHADFTLDVEAAADGPRDRPELLARYRLRNTGSRPRDFALLLAVRPWQVNPPQQFLSTQGGASPVRALAWDGHRLRVDGRVPIAFSTPPARVASRSFDGGLGLAALMDAPPLVQRHDPQQHASAAVQWRFTLAPGTSQVVGWTAPLGPDARQAPAVTPERLDARFDAAADHWRERLNRVVLRVPAPAQPLVDTLRTSLAHILMSRDGPALQPGTRSYARSWIRDGAMMVAGLVRLGEVDAAREFVDWFGGRIFASGKVPCCVDRRGADPVVENDSHGQYLYALAEVWRHTHDHALLERHWPQVQRVVAWMDALRQQERGDANRTADRARLFGLMPPSISHEGYSDKPAYAYWDDFWALRGFKDAVVIAQALGQETQTARWAAARDEFQVELSRSISATARHYGIDFIAGAADRGDFDATSTTVALNPVQADVPADLLAATFEHYWQASRDRAAGQKAWKDYTPYELRTVGAFARLSEPARAHAMLDFFFAHQRPAGWNQWAEVVLPDAREPRFLGDMPHAWVSSDYIRSVLDLFAWERESDDALVIGAGWTAEWLRAGDIEVRGLVTTHGPFDLRLAHSGAGWTLEVPRALAGLAGGVRLRWPEGLPRPQALHGGHALRWQDDGELRLPDGPATVELWAPPPEPKR